MFGLEYWEIPLLKSQNLKSKKTSYEKIIVTLFCRFDGI